MQSVKLKNGQEIVSLVLDKEQARVDIVEKFIGRAQKMKPEVLNELNVNFPGVPGAIIMLRMVNELVELEGCSEEFKLLVQTQRELILKCMGDMPATEDDVKMIQPV